MLTTKSNLKILPIIGLEVHVELKTASKMFCSCKGEHFQAKPNTQVCPICLGLPGALPAANKKAIKWTVMVGMALNCQIPTFSKFDRKNYFYPDLPKGYQISQYDSPLAINGKWSASWRMENGKIIRIRRVHLEEDTAKLVHEQGTTLIDFNRSGVPLMEIVTEPDMNSSEEVKTFLEDLQQIVRYLGVSEADMEKGQMRCEPTVNLEMRKGNQKFYTPLAELKNINSFRFVQKAIDFEIERQFLEFEKTGIEKQPGNKTTRGWSEKERKTFLQRTKEEAQDYRYFPEPDIPPIKWTKTDISNWKLVISNMELPEKKRERFVKEHGLSEYQARILTETRELAEYFEKAVSHWKLVISHWKLEEIRNIANWIINKKVDMVKFLPEELVKMIQTKAKTSVLGEEEFKKAVEEVVKTNPKAVEDYRKGKLVALEFLVGQVAKQTRGKADPNACREFLRKSLS